MIGSLALLCICDASMLMRAHRHAHRSSMAHLRASASILSVEVFAHSFAQDTVKVQFGALCHPLRARAMLTSSRPSHQWCSRRFDLAEVRKRLLHMTTILDEGLCSSLCKAKATVLPFPPASDPQPEKRRAVQSSSISASIDANRRLRASLIAPSWLDCLARSLAKRLLHKALQMIAMPPLAPEAQTHSYPHHRIAGDVLQPVMMFSDERLHFIAVE